MKIFVFEYATSTGSKINSSILIEGFSMLKTTVNGLKREGHYVKTCIGRDILKNGILSADKIYDVDSSRDALSLISGISEDFDFIYAIAPEQELFSIVHFLESEGITHLSSSAEAIDTSGNKLKMARILLENKIKTPGTTKKFPRIIKPVLGAGCEETYLLNNETELEHLPKNEKFINQEYVKGDSLSVTFVVEKNGAFPLCINKQDIEICGNKLHYKGGMTPLNHELKDSILVAAKRAVDAVPGLFGVVGVDLIVSDEIYVIEINPRMVTSFSGLSQVSNICICDSIRGIPPKHFKTSRFSCFGHICAPEDIKFDERIIKKISAIKGIWIPPVFNFAEKGNSIAFAVCTGTTPMEAESKFNELDKKIKRYIS